jgi:hypothetical protein
MIANLPEDTSENYCGTRLDVLQPTKTKIYAHENIIILLCSVSSQYCRVVAAGSDRAGAGW